ncbi:tripartite tricarboxylate transporter permease [Xanthobacter sediminis]
MDTLNLLLHGTSEIVTQGYLTVLFIGLLVGMIVGIMPGLGIVMGIVLVLPFTYSMKIEPSIIMLTAIYMSGTYSGCFTAILYRIPGEPNDIPILWDGYRMSRNGQTSKALGWALISAFIGGMVSTIFMVGLAVPLGKLALHFSTADYFAAVFLGLTSVVSLAGSSIINAFIGLFIGLIVSTVGVDSIYGAERFTFDTSLLVNGVPYVAVLVGMYGFGEVLTRMGQKPVEFSRRGGPVQTKTQFPSWKEIWQIRGTFGRSMTLGTLLGIVPGVGATVTSFIAYGIEKQYGKRRALLGTGLPEGIVAPQIGSTASVAGHMIPLLTLGIPGSGATAIILAAFLLHGVQPGPLLFSTPESKLAVYTIFASMFMAVIGMCLLSFPWIRIVVKVLSIPPGILSAIVIMFSLFGTYADRNNFADMANIVVFGALGYAFERFKFPISPLVLGVVLGPVAESSFMQTMISNDNNPLALVDGPIRGTFMFLAALALLFPLLRHIRWRRPSDQALPA